MEKFLNRGKCQGLLGAEVSFCFSYLELPGSYLDLYSELHWTHVQTPLPVKGT